MNGERVGMPPHIGVGWLCAASAVGSRGVDFEYTYRQSTHNLAELILVCADQLSCPLCHKTTWYKK
jgi:hypothetical protein